MKKMMIAMFLAAFALGACGKKAAPAKPMDKPMDKPADTKPADPAAGGDTTPPPAK
jgi:hypothetical protein